MEKSLGILGFAKKKNWDFDMILKLQELNTGLGTGKL
jgi:hypothetical protein